MPRESSLLYSCLILLMYSSIELFCVARLVPSSSWMTMKLDVKPLGEYRFFSCSQASLAVVMPLSCARGPSSSESCKRDMALLAPCAVGLLRASVMLQEVKTALSLTDYNS